MFGKVGSNREPRINVLVANARGDLLQINAVLDTGFNGWLTLPSDVIRRLGLLRQGQRTAIFANDTQDGLNIYHASVQWHGHPQTVFVFEVEGQPLVGMSLLWGSRITLEAFDGGTVVVEEITLPPP